MNCDSITKSSPVFSRRTNTVSCLKKTQRLFQKRYSGAQSPSLMEVKLYNFSFPKGIDFSCYQDIISLLKEKLRDIRRTLDVSYKNKLPFGYYNKLLYLEDFEKIINCNECAEISNLILHMNKVRNSDTFRLYARSKDGKLRFLDHTVTAIGVKKKQNNKHNPKIFKPSKNVRILDMWLNCLNGTCCKYSNFNRKIREVCNINPDDEILFQPMNTLPLDDVTLKNLKEKYPKLVLDA